MALGKIRLSRSEFLDLTPIEFSYLVKGWSDTNEQKHRSDWERTRWSTWYLVNPHIKKPISTPQGLVKFPWERIKPKKLTKDEIEVIKNPSKKNIQKLKDGIKLD